jgi:hypothetical protein
MAKASVQLGTRPAQRSGLGESAERGRRTSRPGSTFVAAGVIGRYYRAVARVHHLPPTAVTRRVTAGSNGFSYPT